MTDDRLAELLGWQPERRTWRDSSLMHRIRLIVAEAQAEQDGHIYRLREQIARDTDTIYTLRGLLSLARDALADCLDDAPTSDQLKPMTDGEMLDVLIEVSRAMAVNDGYDPDSLKLDYEAVGDGLAAGRAIESAILRRVKEANNG
jgi:hypothetical protein